YHFYCISKRVRAISKGGGNSGSSPPGRGGSSSSSSARSSRGRSISTGGQGTPAATGTSTGKGGTTNYEAAERSFGRRWRRREKEAAVAAAGETMGGGRYTEQVIVAFRYNRTASFISSSNGFLEHGREIGPISMWWSETVKEKRGRAVQSRSPHSRTIDCYHCRRRRRRHLREVSHSEAHLSSLWICSLLCEVEDDSDAEARRRSGKLPLKSSTLTPFANDLGGKGSMYCSTSSC
ncbi:hypothetical protein CRG98_008472, partial [Punica granatum]